MIITLDKDQIPYLYGTKLEVEFDVEPCTLILRVIPDSNTPCYTTLHIHSVGPKQLSELSDMFAILSKRVDEIVKAQAIIDKANGY